MSSTRVSVATTSQLAADAAARVADLGGNAVDCGIAAAMCAINTQPGVCALAGSAFVTIWPATGEPVTIDGNVAIPGLGKPSPVPPPEPVTLAYGGGIDTLIGVSSVAVPGTPAALHESSRRYGRLPWRTVLQPAIDAARDGFPLAAACHYYLEFAGNSVYGRSVDGHGALHDQAGRLHDAGSRIRVPHLADTLESFARGGAREFYEGDIGRAIVAHVAEGGGVLSREDLLAYRPTTRPSLLTTAQGWTLATNPPPAIGGAALVAMVQAFGTAPFADWSPEALQRLVTTQQAVLGYRRDRLDTAGDIDDALAELLDRAASGDLVPGHASASTVHTSAADTDGLACAITASSGYGSGEMPPGTGLWLNNSLGELELNRDGLGAGPPGARLPSNMAPTTLRRGDRVMAIGTPGADRITTALHQFLVNHLQLGLGLDAAVAHPRVHVEFGDDRWQVAAEAGVTLPDLGMPVTRHGALSMYFGGVAAALASTDGHLQAAADPRREGVCFVGPGTAPDDRTLQ